ncbi:MAG: acyl carrier protein [Cyanobacteria bacterium P01_A01_bin.17]
MSLQKQSTPPQNVIDSDANRPSIEDIQAWLSSHLAEELEIEVQSIKPDKDFTEYGLNSINMVNLSGELESFLGCRIDPTLVLSYPNIRLLSEQLVQQSSLSAPSRSPQQQEAERMLTQVDQMSDEEVEGLLGNLLAENEHG